MRPSHVTMSDKYATNKKSDNPFRDMEDNDSESIPQSFNRLFGLTFIYRSYVVIVIVQIFGEMIGKFND